MGQDCEEDKGEKDEVDKVGDDKEDNARRFKVMTRKKVKARTSN